MDLAQAFAPTMLEIELEKPRVAENVQTHTRGSSWCLTFRIAGLQSETAVTRRTRKRNHVSDVFHAGHIHEQAFETQPEPRMGDCAETPCF